MIHHVTYSQLSEAVTKAGFEEMIRASRTWLLKIPEVLSIRSGRNTDQQSQWQFFYSIEVDSLEKLAMVKSDAHYLKFQEAYIKGNVEHQFEMNFELDPSRDLKYS